MTQTIFFSVGEPSGDRHAAALIHELKMQMPQLQVRGFGGDKMAAVGTHLDYELTKLAVVGFAEVLPKLREFFRVKDQAVQIFRSKRIDAVVLVDFPGFNWHIAAAAKQSGIPVFYYMPPQLWAWASWRVRKLKRSVDHVLSALPIEQRFMERHGIDSQWVGHPFFDELYEEGFDHAFVDELATLERQRIAILPGSRSREIDMIWPLQLQILQKLQRLFPNHVMDVACLNEHHVRRCRSEVQRRGLHYLPLQYHAGKTSECIEASSAVLLKSGSSSLEVMARGKPGVVIYHASRSTYAIGRRLSSVRYFSLPNILADREIMPEFLAIGRDQKVIEPAAAAMARLLGDSAAAYEQVQQLQQVYATCGGPGASRRAAMAISGKLAAHQSTSEQQTLREAA